MSEELQGRDAVRSAVALWLRAHRRGEPHGTDELARRACDLGLRTALLACHDHALAADVAHETAIRVMRSVHKLRDPERFDGWVHRITVHELRRAWRRQSRLWPLGDPGPDRAVPDPELTAVIERGAVRGALQSALAGLSPRQRTALALRYVHELSEVEIAQAMGCRGNGELPDLAGQGPASCQRAAASRDRQVQTSKGGRR